MNYLSYLKTRYRAYCSAFLIISDKLVDPSRSYIWSKIPTLLFSGDFGFNMWNMDELRCSEIYDSANAGFVKSVC